MVTIIAGLLAAGDLTPVDTASSRYLHVYYLDVPRFLGQGFQDHFPAKNVNCALDVVTGRLTMDLFPGNYRMSRPGYTVSNATVQGTVLSVPAGLYRAGHVGRQRQLNDYALEIIHRREVDRDDA